MNDAQLIVKDGVSYVTDPEVSCWHTYAECVCPLSCTGLHHFELGPPAPYDPNDESVPF